MLTRKTCIGIEFDNQTSIKRDPLTGCVTVARHPKENWQRREVPHLRIISDDLFERTQQRLKDCQEAFSHVVAKRGLNRTDVYPTQLIRPLYEHCQIPLILGHPGEHPSFMCPNGRGHRKGCKLTTYKSVKLFDRKLLKFLRQHFLTKEVIETAWREANRYLREQAHRPKEDTKPILDEMKRETAARNRLAKLIDRESEGEESESDDELGVLVDLLRQRERRLKVLQQQLRDTEARIVAPTEIPKADAEALLQNLQSLLGEDVALSAPILAKLTGPIEVRQSESSGRKVKPWIARFLPNLAALIAEAIRQDDHGDRAAWQFVAQQVGDSADFIEILIDQVPRYEELAPKFKELRDQGKSIEWIASAYRVTWLWASATLHFAETGERPKTGRKKNEEQSERSGTTKDL